MARLPLVRPVHPFAQLFPLMEGAEFDALCKDIKANGLVAPSPCWIAVSSMAATANAPATRWAYRSGQAVHRQRSTRLCALDEPAPAPPFNESQRAMVAAKLANMREGRPGKTTPIGGVSQSAAAKLLNVSPRSLQRAKAVYENVITTVVQRVERGEVAVAAATKLIGLPEVEQRRFVDASEATLRKQSAQAYRRRTARAATPIPNGMEYRIGDCRVVLNDIKPNSVALILCDPPYADEADPLYEWLAGFAARVLVEGGSLIFIPGNFAMLRRGTMAEAAGLRFWSPLVQLHTEPQRMYGRGVLINHKEVLWFTKGLRRGKSLVPTELRPVARDKELHPWSQADGGIQPLIEHLTELNELIIDPFAGSGEWGRIAHSLGRRWIGSDVVRGGDTVIVADSDGLAMAAE